VAAWKLLSDYRYRYHVDLVRHAVRVMRSGATPDEIVLAVQRDYPSFEKWRVLACLREMQENDEITFAPGSGVVRLADPKPIVREE
jgi:hypothetical protein